MRSKLTYLLLCLIFCLNAELCMAQEINNVVVSTRDSISTALPFKKVKFIPGLYSYLNVDILDNVYLITSANRLCKYNSKGDSLAAYNDVKRYGNPSFIDVSNPLKILVYYKNYYTIVALDRFLTFRNSINLRDKNIFSVQTAATAYDNNCWIFDEQDFKIKKIDDQGKLLLESADLRQLINDAPFPSKIIDCDNQLYVYDENKGLYIFDYYGAIKTNIPLLHWQNISASRNILYGFVEDNLFAYQLNSLDLKKYPLGGLTQKSSSIKAMNGKLYLLKSDGVEIYEIQ